MRFLIGLVAVLFSFNGFSQCVSGDCENGFGKYECSCGYVFEGYFANGQKKNGTLTKKDLVYTGEFKDDVAEGYGVMKYKDGSWFEGSFTYNTPDGYGTYHFATGREYVGEIKDGSFAGLGVQIYRDMEGRIIETQFGVYNGDRLNGMGCSLSFNGDIYVGQYVNGSFMGFGVYIFSEQEMAEAGRFRKMKLKDNVIMNDYPEKGYFGVKGYMLDSLSYNLSGDVYASNVQISVYDSSSIEQVVYFSLTTKQLFISDIGTDKSGKVINENGDIFKAKFDPNQKPYITLLDQFYFKK